MRLNLLIKTILNQMNAIEAKHGKIFSDIDSTLECDIFEAIDTKNFARLNNIIKRLDSLS